MAQIVVTHHPKLVMQYSAVMADEKGRGVGYGSTPQQAREEAITAYYFDCKIRARQAQLRAEHAALSASALLETDNDNLDCDDDPIDIQYGFPCGRGR